MTFPDPPTLTAGVSLAGSTQAAAAVQHQRPTPEPQPPALLRVGLIAAKLEQLVAHKGVTGSAKQV